MAKHRDSRINEELRKVISDVILHDIKDPDVGFVSIVRADVSHDLRTAKIYYSVMGDAGETGKTKAALKRCSGFIRRQVADKLDLRYTPELNFIFDDSIEHGIRIAHILEEEKKKHPVSSDENIGEDENE